MEIDTFNGHQSLKSDQVFEGMKKSVYEKCMILQQAFAPTIFLDSLPGNGG
jgi:hypothetical protein